MSNQAKFALVKQSMGVDRKIVAVWEYEVRRDARNEADRLNKGTVKFHYFVMPLKVGKIQRKAPKG